MQLIKIALKKELDNMNHSEREVYDPELRIEFDEIDWHNVYQNLYDLLEDHFDSKWLESPEAGEVLEQVIEEAQESEWARTMLWEARHGWRDRTEMVSRPYRYHGISKSDFV